MGKKAIKWLYQELPKLVTKGILTRESADKLRQHYGEAGSPNKRIILFIACGVLGALLIGLGIILLIGHNWEQFPRFVRAILSIALLAVGQVFALWVLLKRPKSHALKEGSATFLSLMVGASIALICQTYNIPGNAGTFTLTWMLLIVPLVYLMQASLPAAIYLIGITIWSGSHWNNPTMGFLFWPLAAVIVPHFIWALRREIYTIRTTILSLIMAICIGFGASFGLGKNWTGSWVVIYSSIYAILYSLGNWSFKGLTRNWQRPLRLIGALGILILAFQFTFKFSWQYVRPEGVPYELKLLPGAIMTILIIATAIVLFYDNLKRRDSVISLFTALPLLALVAFFSRGESTILPLLIFNVYLFVLGINCIATGNRNNSLGAINAGMLILAILIMIRFFDSNINFILKGLAFIAVGSGFLATNIMLMRRKGGIQ